MTIMRRHQTTTTRTALFIQQIHCLLANVHNLNIPDDSKDKIHDLLIQVNRIAERNI